MDEKLPLHERLKQLKEVSRMTTHQISVKSNVPESTISRILSGETDRPSFLVVSQIVAAMDGSLDVLAGIKQDHDVNTENHLREQLMDAQRELDAANARSENLGKWISRLFALICVLIGAITIVFILDHCSPEWGYFRH